ncbi:MAG TPA: DUF1295 domain-containing protein [Steroidobacteraceae bacterium]|nr:DUF1295 domain-containing protein [Steroidobacteraceae bacterium]
MLDLRAALLALFAVLALAVLAWAVSVARHDASLVDRFWSLFFLCGAATYTAATGARGARATVVLVLLAAWALRLALYITWRNWGGPEDHRYRAIRRRNEPGFAWKSLYLVFGLQGLLASLISLPILAAIGRSAPLNPLDGAGLALWLLGFAFEVAGDAQLAHFRADPQSRGRVLDTGLWRYTRHPNYFGEATLWWGFYLLAAATGAYWTVVSPLLMTYMLLRVSGVALLEQDIHERRPAYRAYIARTSPFLPRPPRREVIQP